jgi:hypothetical protein
MSGRQRRDTNDLLATELAIGTAEHLPARREARAKRQQPRPPRLAEG